MKFSAVPSFTDFGEDIDNCPKNTKELKRLDQFEVTMSGSFVAINPDTVKTMIGAADIESVGKEKVTPRADLKDTDFGDVWWVGDYGNVDGGVLAIHMIDALERRLLPAILRQGEGASSTSSTPPTTRWPT